MIVLANWISDLFSTFSDATFYFVLAAIGTSLFVIRLILMLAFGLDDGGDFDTDMDPDGGGLEAHGGDFSLFSMISILSFMMGAGWLGLAARLDWGLGPVAAAGFASLFGFGLMLLSSLALWQMKKLNTSGAYDLNSCVGNTARVYLRIPPKGEGRGQVQVSVTGRQLVVDALSNGPGIESFKSVTVLEVRDDGTLLVEPA